MHRRRCKARRRRRTTQRRAAAPRDWDDQMKKNVSTLPNCCTPVLQGKLKQADAEQLALGFKAIADPARLRLLSFIAAQPSGEACVCYLTKPLDIAQPTVSHHLKVLYDA